MDSDALLTFVAVHDAGGFSAAADKLHRSQPAVSRRIAVLEAELGGPVFERGAGRAALTQLGQALLPHALKVLAALEDARSAVGALAGADAGAIALAAVGTLAGPELSDLLRRFRAHAPQVELTLRTATSSQVSELVRRGEATLGLRYFEDRAPDLQCHAMAPERLVVVCAPDHPLAGGSVSGLADLAEETWLAFPRREETGEIAAETLFAEFQRRRVGAFRWSAIDSLTAQKRLAEAGYGISLTPERAVAEERAAGTLRTITVEDLDAVNPVFAVQRKDGYLSGAAQALLTLLTVRA